MTPERLHSLIHDVPTYYISVTIQGQYMRMPLKAPSDTGAYEIACALYGKDNVLNDASQLS